MTEEQRLKAHLGEALGEAVFERACIIWCDRVPWERALDQAEALETVPALSPGKEPGGRDRSQPPGFIAPQA